MNWFLGAHFWKIVSVSVLLFILLDFCWLSLVARKLYLQQLGYLAQVENGRIRFRLGVGVFAQVIIALGLCFVAALSLRLDNSLCSSLVSGGIAGFVMYCTFDLTCLSFVKDFPLKITLVDIAWGTAQGLFAGGYVYLLYGFFS